MDKLPQSVEASSTTTDGRTAPKTDVVGEVASNIWIWIGITLAAGAYGALYLQLPPWVQLWFDPRLLALLIALFVFVVVVGIQNIRKSFAKDTLEHLKQPPINKYDTSSGAS